MKVQIPTNSGDEARVVRFRPRTLLTAPGRPRGGATGQKLSPTANDASYLPGTRPDADDTSTGDNDEFRHRMLANTAALVFTIALTAVGIWLAMSIADLRSTQDCALVGRHNCAPIASPHV